MEKKIFNSLGMMSGTSMDGVDISIIKTDGLNYLEKKIDKYYDFPDNLFKKLINIREKIKSKRDLKTYDIEIKNEREFTLFHISLIKELILENEIDIIGFHGQTIFHSPNEGISFQIGNGKLLSQILNKTVVYNFRKKDINNRGQGAPLTPIYHNLIAKNKFKNPKVNTSLYFINIGGITNMTKIDKSFDENLMEGYDIGPGNCLIDSWIRKNSDLKFDTNGKIANSGKLNKLVLNQAIDNFQSSNYKNSLDINDFDINFLRGLDFEEGCATVTEFTAFLISNGINNLKEKNNDLDLFIFCGGGRKNKYLLKRIEHYINKKKKFIIKN